MKIRELLAHLGHGGKHPVVDTVERIQGRERDLVFLSMTLSDPDLLAGESEFLFLPNRFNVAMTRARKKLVVISSPSFFRALPRHGARLADVNVLKRWYFSHRASAVDATDLARHALVALNGKRSEEEAATNHESASSITDTTTTKGNMNDAGSTSSPRSMTSRVTRHDDASVDARGIDD